MECHSEEHDKIGLQQFTLLINAESQFPTICRKRCSPVNKANLLMLDTIGSSPEWTKRKLALIGQHAAEWQLCFALEDGSWHSMKQRHNQRQQELQAEPWDVLKQKELIKQQVRDIREWHDTINRYRQKLQEQQGQQTLNLDEEKRNLATYF